MADVTAYEPFPTTYRSVSSITIKDGTGTPQIVTITLYDSGTLTFTPERDIKVIKHRGLITYVIAGDEMGLPISFTIPHGEFSGTTTPSPGTDITPWEAITGEDIGGRLAGVTWLSTLGTGQVHGVDIDFKVQSPLGAAGDHEVLSFLDFVWDGLPWSGGDEYNTLEISGRAYGSELPTIVHTDAA